MRRTNRSTIRRRLRLAPLLVIALILAACGMDQPGANDSAVQPTPLRQPTAAAGPSPAPTDDSPGAPTPSLRDSSPAITATPSDSSAAFDPRRVTIALEQVGSGFSGPLYVTHAGDGSGRVFVVEKRGVIRLLEDGRTFLDISDRVRSSGSEQGLLGLAFHPDFAANGRFFVHYSDLNGNTVISRFELGLDADAADPGSEEVILRQDQPAANHNGGEITFGPDGYLYIGLGDGGGANDTFGNAQRRDTLLGKLLRIDVDGGDPYAVPDANPFVNDSTFRPEIFAYGLRNPWRFSFDRATGDLYIADVGQNRYEWVHYRPAGEQGGENFGWPILEGFHCLSGATCDRTGLTEPVIEYDHSLGCAITGGYVYRGEQYPIIDGVYFFGDYCSGRVWAMQRDDSGQWQATEMLRANIQLSSFGEDEAGEIYVTDLRGGGVYRLTASEIR